MQRAARSVTAILLLTALRQVTASGQDVNAVARVDSTQYLVGDPISVHVVLAHPGGLTFQPLVGDTLGGFQVIGREVLRNEGESKTVGLFVVARYDSGDAMLPPLTFLYTLPGDTVARRVLTNGLSLSIRTVPVDTSQGIKDLKPPIGIPISLAEIALYLGIALVLVALGYAVYRFWKKRKAAVKGEAFVPPPRPAHVIALEELSMLKEKKLWQRGLIKQYYTEVTETFRRYIENRYKLMALEETTGEIVGGLRKLRMTGDLLQRADDILQRADLVKFAKHTPGITEHEETLSFVYDFVEKTKISETGGGGHVGN